MNHILKKNYWKNLIGLENFIFLWSSVLEYLSGSGYVRTNYQYEKGTIHHLVRTQNFPKNSLLSPPDTRKYVCVSEGKKCLFSGKICVRNKWMTQKQGLSFSHTVWHVNFPLNEIELSNF